MINFNDFDEQLMRNNFIHDLFSQRMKKIPNIHETSNADIINNNNKFPVGNRNSFGNFYIKNFDDDLMKIHLKRQKK